MKPNAIADEQALVAQEIATLAARLVAAMDDHVARAAAAHDLNVAEARALCEVAGGASCSGADLAERLNFDASHITGLADRLEARGLIERQPDPCDRRIKRLQATAAGVDLEHALRAQMYLAPPTSELSITAQRALRNSLKQALNALEPRPD